MDASVDASTRRLSRQAAVTQVIRQAIKRNAPSRAATAQSGVVPLMKKYSSATAEEAVARNPMVRP
jgi:hypothetical protein